MQALRRWVLGVCSSLTRSPALLKRRTSDVSHQHAADKAGTRIAYCASLSCCKGLKLNSSLELTRPVNSGELLDRPYHIHFCSLVGVLLRHRYDQY
jgi:hypothetical protein